MNNIEFINKIHEFLTEIMNALDNDKISKKQIRLLIFRFIGNYLKKSIEIEELLNEVFL